MKSLLGKRIRDIRENKGLTQEFVSKKLGMSRQKLARIENGINDISYELILSLSEIFSISPNEITKVAEANTHGEFRTGGHDISTFSKVEEMITLFYANKSLYLKMISEDNDDI